MLILQIYNRQFMVWQLLGFDPCIKQTFANKAKYAEVISVIVGNIDSLFQLKQNAEEPFAVTTERFVLHNEHVKAMPLCALH